jgi:hypothetical protein
MDLMEFDIVALDHLQRNSPDIWFFGHHTLVDRDRTRVVFAWNSGLRNSGCEEKREESSRDSTVCRASHGKDSSLDFNP